METARYSSIETLSDGRLIEIRALRPADRNGLLAALDQSSAESRYRRFFSRKSSFTEDEIAYFLDIDFATHVALVAVDDAGRGTIIAGGRYILIKPGSAEVAFFVADSWQGKGIGAALMRNLVAIARSAGLDELSAEVLADNRSMLAVFKKCGRPLQTSRDGGVVHLTIKLS